MSNEKFKIVITSASSETAKSLREKLPSSVFKNADVRFLDGEDVEGTLMEYDSGVELIKKMTLESFYKKDLVFFCGSARNTQETVKTIIGEYGDDSPLMIDLSCPAPLNTSDVLLRDFPVKSQKPTKGLITLPNPLASGIATVIDIINRFENVKAARISTQIPVSDLGKKGIEELQNQMVELINHGEIPEDDFGQQLIFNQIPGHGDNAAGNLTDYEACVASQINYLLGDSEMELFVSTNLSPIFFSYSMDMFLSFEKPLEVNRISSAFEKLDGFCLASGKPLPGPIQATKNSKYQITRIVAPGKGNDILISCAFDNIYTASVKHAIELAEEICGDNSLLK